jgi:NTP pyrophosphatase (non-canonical NTP hydrolase)
MNIDISNDIFKATLDKWGVEAQYDQTIEECAELITALKHFKRGKASETKIIEELADVLLMTHQLIFMLGEDRVSQAIDNKLRKLEKLLQKP